MTERSKNIIVLLIRWLLAAVFIYASLDKIWN